MIEAITVGFAIIAAYLAGYFTANAKPGGPIISTDSFCPACGNPGCNLFFKNEIGRNPEVERICKVCSCSVRQPVVAPDLFAKLK